MHSFDELPDGAGWRGLLHCAKLTFVGRPSLGHPSLVRLYRNNRMSRVGILWETYQETGYALELFADPLTRNSDLVIMVRVSVLNDCLNNINNAERRGKRQVIIRPSSKVIVRFLTVMQKHGYIEEFEEVDDHRSGKLVIQLNGRINKCGVISPRFNVQLGQIENWVALLLPARSFGYIILTTSAGIMDHEEARRKHVAGKVIGYVY
ncbi:uncharacterized protein L969DRAFT_96344 [Mixia osmundae IAM 14324]|uniref:40S ribosomal protein S22 n=1 Tax=Mixia osmundae (strain CBS 9802 / IAM 14324 / JCM 22182 / KY 12970) TaxID=764103 RepID=G7DV02_MIXOS|nr:uncharacterized protein L969DRAFT_96344 [Mixia osmundae IAM 14324]KEI37255.1 hypothetical protein L969DRAFT_96344 [Mixia osmundae IAM 14324]GAA94412.1 hypothetical protein E5Q_01064 [Mixia osmundae IAM 14324]